MNKLALGSTRIVTCLMYVFIVINCEPRDAVMGKDALISKAEKEAYFEGLIDGLSKSGQDPYYHPDYSFLRKNMPELHPVSNVLDELLFNYDNRLRPNFGGKPVIVNITMNIDSIGPISEVDMNFRIDISFRQYWVDDRLKFNDTFEPLTVNHKFLDKIWQPDTYFPESYESKKQHVMIPNILLRIKPGGEVLYSSRVTVIAKCPMKLTYFPMDVQKCKLLIEAFGYTSKDLILQWGDNPVERTNESVKLAQFEFINLMTRQFFLNFTTGNFSDLEVEFTFKRSLIYFIIQTYVPSTLIVILSWVNFWVNRHSVPARASLAITTVLTMITLMGSTNAALPRVSSIKALDIYFGICFFYVFGALVEFALVCYFNKPRYAPRPQKTLFESSKTRPCKEINSKSHPKNVNSSKQCNGGVSILNPFSLARENQTSPLMKRYLSQVSASHSYSKSPEIPQPSPLLKRYVSSAEHSEMSPCIIEPQPICTPAVYITETSHSENVSSPPTLKRRRQRRRRRPFRTVDVSKIDLYSRIMFPLTYVIICMVYWMVYLGVSETDF